MCKKEILFEITPFDTEVTDIVGIIDGFLYLRTYEFSSEEIICVKIHKDIFKQLIDEWMKAKEDTCRRYKHFAGAHGAFYPKKFKKIKKINLLINLEELEEIHPDKWKPIYKDVDTYEIIEMDIVCDMEHG